MSAGSPNEDSSPRLAPPPAASADSADGLLGHFDRLVMVIELIDRLPDLAEDIRLWRPRGHIEWFRGDGPGEATDRNRALRPLARHAFDAVVAGLNTLGLAAVALCENAGGRLPPDEIAACREIGVVMDRLLARARALIETAEQFRLATDPDARTPLS
ncbi:MAG: hypothetical protein ACLPSW_13820 [Roseiarcus sp.]